MGNLGVDTEVRAVGGANAAGEASKWTATFSPDWEIWGPNGGYVAAVALRAAGVHTDLRRPASLLCHYLGVGKFAPVDIETVTLRKAKRAESIRVSIAQEGAPIAEALVWCVSDDLEGLEHDVTSMPSVKAPADIPTMAELDPEAQPPRHAFGKNFEMRVPNWLPWEEWEKRETFDGTVLQWMRYRPQPTFDDKFVDAARAVILLDTYQWPAACNAYKPGTNNYQAPSLDLSVSFHDFDPTSEWLLVDAKSPLAKDGLVGGQACIWSENGKLLASGGQQMLCRPFRP